MRMYGEGDPEVSAGSNHAGVGEKLRAHVICPSGAAAPEAAPRITITRTANAMKRPRTCFIGSSLVMDGRFSSISAPRRRDGDRFDLLPITRSVIPGPGPARASA